MTSPRKSRRRRARRGQALCEHCVYDARSQQPLSGSLTDYAMPRADASSGRLLLAPHRPAAFYGSIAGL
jgi:hypothetical protein